ncbi:ribonuclease H-like domain-containing protein [Tanacetum coccineum]
MVLNLLHDDLNIIHEDDMMKGFGSPMALLSMRAREYYQRLDARITINESDTAGYDKSKVEYFNCHKMGHFARECRGHRNQESRPRNQDSSRRTMNVEDTSSYAMVAIDRAGFDWSFMAEEEVTTNMTLMDFSDSEVYNNKTCSNTCLKSFKALKTQLDNLRVEFNKSEFNLATYKRGLASVEEQLVFYKKNEVMASNILSYSGLDEFKEPEFKGYGTQDSKKESNVVCDKKSDESKENSDNSLVKEQVSKDTSSFVESSLNVDKETVFPVDKKVESVKPKDHEKPVKKSVRYAEMYRSQSPRGNQRNWNGQKSNQLGSDFVMYNKACFICGSFNHVQAQCKNHQRERMVYGNNYNRVNYNYTTKRTHPNAQRNMVPRAVLMKTGLKTFNTVRTVNTAHL